MKNTQPPEEHLSVLVARNGPLLVFQSFWKQALFIQRDNIPKFIDDPESAPVLVIQPLPALALQCYLALKQVHSITLKRDLAISDDFTLTAHNTGDAAVRFYSRHDNMHGPRTLRAERVGVVITPQMVALLDNTGMEPRLSVVVESKSDDLPDYPNRFAIDPRLLAEAVARSVSNSLPTLRYEN